MRHDSSYLRDALQALDELNRFLPQTNRERFLQEPMEQSYLFHRLVIIGEAIVQLAKVFQQKYPGVEWVRLIALRNRLVHAYFNLDQELLWNAVNRGLTPLREQLVQILQQEFPDQSAES